MALLILAWACSRTAADTEPTDTAAAGLADLLIVSIDALRRDHVGRYGGPETPFLDALAARSLALDAHHACSNWTYGAMVCALAGADGVDVGFVPYGSADPVIYPDEIPILPGYLREHGFASALMSTNGYLGQTSKISRFYDHFDHESLGAADVVVDRGLALFDEVSEAERWLFHLHFFDPHSPYGAPDAYLGELEALDPIDYALGEMTDVERLAGQWEGLDEATQALILEHLDVRYRASIQFLDDELERLWVELEARAALDDALVVVFSDHGEQFYEYGEIEHGKSMHGVEVDGFAWLAGPTIDAQPWTGPTTHGDLSPTILAELGLPPRALEPDVDLGGLGVVVGQADPERALYGVKRDELGAHQYSVDRSGKRLIYTVEEGWRLHDLAADPEEREDLYDSDPEAEELRALLEPRVEALQGME